MSGRPVSRTSGVAQAFGDAYVQVAQLRGEEDLAALHDPTTEEWVSPHLIQLLEERHPGSARVVMVLAQKILAHDMHMERSHYASREWWTPMLAWLFPRRDQT